MGCPLYDVSLLDLNDGQITQTENVEPYALFGDRAGDFDSGNLILQESNVLSLDLYTNNNLGGDRLATITRNFSIVDDGGGGNEPGLIVGIYDADTDELIAPLTDGSVVDANTLTGRSITIAAEVAEDSLFSGQIGSMALDLNAVAIVQVENVSPYALFGDRNGDFRGGSLPTGENTITFDLFSGRALSGNLLDTVAIAFTIAADL